MKVVKSAMELAERSFQETPGGGDPARVSMSLMESLFKCSPEVSLRLIELGVLDFILKAIGNCLPSPVRDFFLSPSFRPHSASG